jgi:hypothetical protein
VPRAGGEAAAAETLAEEEERIEAESRAERRFWGRWADKAAEGERERRMLVLAEMEHEEEAERHVRRAWAVMAIEQVGANGSRTAL